MNKLSTVELFSGPGGLGLGFHFEGFETIVAYEYEDDCIETYKRNFPHTTVMKKDLFNFTKKDIAEMKKIVFSQIGKKSVDVVMGGPPCRSFSTANPKKTKNDKRDFLYQTLIVAAKELNARYFVMENVEDINSKQYKEDHKKKVIHKIFEDLIAAGYKYINFNILNAADYGVPQTRERLFIVATQDPTLPIVFPSPCYSKSKHPKWVDLSQVLNDLPKVSSPGDNIKGINQELVKREGNNYFCDQYPSEPTTEYERYCRGYQNVYGYMPFKWSAQISKLNNFIIPKHTERILKRYKLLKVDENQGDLVRRLQEELSPSDFEFLIKSKVIPESVFIQKNRKLPINVPSRTVTSHVREELVHPTYDRNLTAREAARIQSFPDWYIFEGINQKPYKKTQNDIGNGRDYYQQAGDAVPPLLAAAVARELRKSLEGENGSAQNSELRAKAIENIIAEGDTAHEIKRSKHKSKVMNLLTGL